MQNAHGNDNQDRPVVTIIIGWNPNTGQLDLNAKDANPAEILGVLQMATLEAYMATKRPAPGGRIIPASMPMTPHLKGN
jgi:hypothetical protein